MQGVLQLLEMAEIRDVFATAGVQFEQLKRMGRFAGVVLQLQGMMQKGFSKVCSQYLIQHHFYSTCLTLHTAVQLLWISRPDCPTNSAWCRLLVYCRLLAVPEAIACNA